MLNTDKLSESNYNSLLQNLINQSLNSKKKPEINSDEHRSKLIGHISEEKEHQIPVKLKNDIVYPHKIKDECDRSINRFEFIQDNSMSKEWDNI
jgi:hypothetical protein